MHFLQNIVDGILATDILPFLCPHGGYALRRQSAALFDVRSVEVIEKLFSKTFCHDRFEVGLSLSAVLLFQSVKNKIKKIPGAEQRIHAGEHFDGSQRIGQHTAPGYHREPVPDWKKIITEQFPVFVNVVIEKKMRSIVEEEFFAVPCV